MLTHPALTRASRAGVRLGLQRVAGFLSHLGSPHLDYPVLHVAGTNGKGSVCALLTAALRASGLKVGTYISPHLQQVNERISVDGQPISDEALSALLEEIPERTRGWEGAPLAPEGVSPLTYFELMTVAAFVHFSRQRVQAAVIEVGLGGRLDATNVVQSSVGVITSVGLDHTDVLGDDLGSVAGEKAGILRRGVPMAVGPLPREAMRVVRSLAIERESPLQICGEDFRAEKVGPFFDWTGPDGARHERLCTPLAGSHQIENAAVAVAALRAFGARHPELAVSETALREGLSRARHPGRCEWLAEDVLVDGAHNADGARRLAEYLATLPRDRPRTLLIGASKDKDIRSVAAALAPEVDRVFTTRCAHPRAYQPGEVAEQLVGLSLPPIPAGPIEDALPMARAREGLVIVAGSLFLVGAARDLLGHA